jgi:subtilisin-like proprotein convertase family protein
MNWIVSSLITTVGLLPILAAQTPSVAGPDRRNEIKVDAPVGPSTVYSTGDIATALTDNGTVDSQLVVPLGGTVIDISVRVRLNHPRTSELEVQLISPDGTAVMLANNAGGLTADYGAAGASCSGLLTTFDDDATTSVMAGTGPFLGVYRPDRRLSNFHGRGTPGTWRLRISDNIAGASGTLYCWQLVLRRTAMSGDVFGDGRSDLAYWRPGSGLFVRNIEGVAFTTYPENVGATQADILAPMNGGSGSTPPAWFSPSTGEWRGSFNAVVWGGAGDVPVPGDYNADGIDDLAVWRPSTGTWYVRNQFSWAWGGAGDIPVPGDYNGDGTADMAVWRPSTGAWYVYGVTSLTWGGAGDIPVPADYDGDGRTDFGIWRPVTGEWFIYTAAGVVQPVHVWGGNGDIPVPADYDGDLRAELAVWRPSDGTYYIRNVGTVQWGQAGDVPIQKRPAYPGYPY